MTKRASKVNNKLVHELGGEAMVIKPWGWSLELPFGWIGEVVLPTQLKREDGSHRELSESLQEPGQGDACGWSRRPSSG